MSNETRWTAGPWVVTYEAGDFDESVGVSMDSHQSNPNHYRTAHLWHSDCEPDCEETVANAHLIAAAPELYEALDMLMDATGPGDAAQLLAEERENIMALLAKARGES